MGRATPRGETHDIPIHDPKEARMTTRPLTTTAPAPCAVPQPLTSPPSNPAIDPIELGRRMAALESVLGR
jgi:hypothetical protein